LFFYHSTFVGKQLFISIFVKTLNLYFNKFFKQLSFENHIFFLKRSSETLSKSLIFLFKPKSKTKHLFFFIIYYLIVRQTISHSQIRSRYCKKVFLTGIYFISLWSLKFYFSYLQLNFFHILQGIYIYSICLSYSTIFSD